MTMTSPTRRGSGRARRLLRFAGSVVVSAALLVGVPWGLVVMARNPVDRLPDLLAGDASSGVLLAVIAGVLWVAWAQFVVAFGVELVSAVRRTPVPARIRFPGFGVQQVLARALISGALMLLPVATTAIAPAAAVMAMPPAAVTVSTGHTDAATPNVLPVTGVTVTLTADGPHTWWDLAAAYLGDGTQWRQLWDLNVGRPQPDGSTLHSSTAPLRAGWTVTLPAAAVAPVTADEPIEVVVQPGQTLSQIAADHGRHWPDVWRGNAGRVEPTGVFDDPDYVEPGWTITIPAATADQSAVTVQPGDTLSGIAAAHDTDVAALMTANAGMPQPGGDQLIDPDVIEPGWQLRIPSSPDTAAAGQDAGSAPSAASADTAPAAAPADAAATAASESVSAASEGESAPSEDAGASPLPVAPVTPPADAATEAAPQVLPRAGLPSADQPGAQPPADATQVPADATPSAAAPSLTPPVAADAAAAATLPDPAGAGVVDEQGESSAAASIVVFSGAGALLAALLLSALLRARARQRSFRRPGEVLVGTPEHLVEVEKVLRSAGGAAAADAQWLDEALHGLAQAAAAGGAALPDVLAAAVTGDELRLVLATPASTAAGGWQAHRDGTEWVLARHADTGYDPQTRGQLMPPYPTLVTVGCSDEGVHWLLDLERIGSLTLTGDPARSADLARFLAAELAHNSWSELLQITLVGIGAEMAAMYPDRLAYAEDPEQALAAAAAQLQAINQVDTAVLDGRSGRVGGESFAPHVVLIDPAALADHGPVDDLVTAVTEHPDRSTVAVVVTAAQTAAGAQRAWEITVDRDGVLTIPQLDLRLRAQQLPRAQAGQLAQLLALAAGPGRRARPGTVDDAAEPAGGPVGAVTMLPTATVEDGTATTWEDQQALAEPVPAEVRRQIEAGDGDLDADLAEWLDPAGCRPRIGILGPVDVRPQGGQTKRKLSALRAEAAVHLAVHSTGVTAERLAGDLWPTEPGIAGSRLRQMVYDLRRQFGINPRTGTEYLPRSDGAGGTYRLDDVLIDGELVRRLRLRASIREETDLRVRDWWRALELVRGVPLSHRRAGGYAWLADRQIDEEYRALIVDVAHQLATHHLAAGEPALAEKAARIAMSACDPADDTSLLDLIWACDAQGRRAEGDAHAAQIQTNHGDVLEDCPPRTYQLLLRRQRRAA
jgi:LysM repeat protein